MKFGAPKPRGDNFKAILQDLQAIIGGESFGEVSAKPATPKTPSKNEPPPVNVPLKQSDNQRARELVDLDEKFLVDPDEMSAAAAGYFRQRPYLTPEVCRAWRMGYLPRCRRRQARRHDAGQGLLRDGRRGGRGAHLVRP